MKTTTILGWGLLGLALGACGAKDDSNPSTTANQSGDDGNDTATDEGEDDGNDDANDDANDDGNDDANDDANDDGNDTETDDGTDPDTGSVFILEPDGGSIAFECDIWGQDCPEGEKCMPWSNDGTEWNATRCSPLDPNPAQPGDSCTVEGGGTSGLDNCSLGAMCWNVDPETNIGTCVPFCAGSEANPICEDPSTTCTIANEGALILCLPNCDPLLQDCQEGEACYPVGDTFVCGPDASQEMGIYGDSCAYINDCDSGLFCADAAAVPDCAGSGCCSSFCDTSDPEANANCPGSAGGQECVAWFEEGQSPPGLENVGGCAIPN